MYNGTIKVLSIALLMMTARSVQAMFMQRESCKTVVGTDTDQYTFLQANKDKVGFEKAIQDLLNPIDPAQELMLKQFNTFISRAISILRHKKLHFARLNNPLYSQTVIHSHSKSLRCFVTLLKTVRNRYISELENVLHIVSSNHFFFDKQAVYRFTTNLVAIQNEINTLDKACFCYYDVDYEKFVDLNPLIQQKVNRIYTVLEKL